MEKWENRLTDNLPSSEKDCYKLLEEMKEDGADRIQTMSHLTKETKKRRKEKKEKRERYLPTSKAQLFNIYHFYSKFKIIFSDILLTYILFIQSRMNPSRNISNAKPWEEIRVGPGLNKGYTNKPSGGFGQNDTRDYVQLVC